ncbi:DUF1499 domain-containing protein [bacterium]|nr:DUF1499 domain-containing protein [bacterium]
MKIALFIALGLVAVVLIIFTIYSVKAQSGNVAKGLSSEGLVSPCGDKPNCLSTSDERDGFSFESVAVKNGTTVNGISKALIDGYGPEVMKVEDNYLHLVFRTGIFKFPDDVEFSIKDGQLLIRSQSRAGRKDFGTNRKRMKDLLSTLKSADLI